LFTPHTAPLQGFRLTGESILTAVTNRTVYTDQRPRYRTHHQQEHSFLWQPIRGFLYTLSIINVNLELRHLRAKTRQTCIKEVIDSRSISVGAMNLSDHGRRNARSQFSGGFPQLRPSGLTYSHEIRCDMGELRVSIARTRETTTKLSTPST